MSVNIGPRIGIEGEAEYRKSIQNIIQQQKTLKSEMEATSSAWDKNTKAEKKATDQKKILSAQIKTQDERVKILNDMLEKSAKKYGETDTKTLKWKEALNQANAELNKMKADLADLPSDVELLGKKFEESGEKIKGVGDNVGNVGKALAPVSTAAAGLIGGLTTLGYKSVTAADDLNTLAKQTGISTDELQKMQYASALVDVSVEDITGAVRKMKSNMTKDTGAVGEAWARLGISTTDATGQMRPAIDVFYDTIAALGGVANETERDQLAMALFGKSADSLAGIIDDGGVSLQAYGAEAENLGLILSEDTLASLNTVNDTLDQTKAQLDSTFAALGATVAEALAPTIERATDAIKQFTESLRSVDPETMKAILVVGGVVAAVSPLIIIIGQLITSIGAIVGVVGKLIPALAAINPVTALIVAGIAAVVAVGVELYKNWDTIKAKAAEFAQSVSEKWNLLCSIIKTNVEQSIADIIAAKDKVSETFQAIHDKIKSTIENARDAVKDAIEKIKGFFDFEWKLPDIKLPHFSITGQFSLNPPSIPHISVEWYSKAMRYGMILNSPTIFGAQNGRLLGGGEAGPEVVVGASSLYNMIRGAMASTTNNYGGNNVYVYGAPGQDVRELANEIADIINADVQAKGAAWA